METFEVRGESLPTPLLTLVTCVHLEFCQVKCVTLSHSPRLTSEPQFSRVQNGTGWRGLPGEEGSNAGEGVSTVGFE